MTQKAIYFALSVVMALTACQDPSLDLTSAKSSEIRVVGSSTVYPFSTKVAQEFKNITGHNVVVEATGSGGGHKLFCSGSGKETPDVTNSSRRQKKSEFELCKKNGVKGIVEVKIGYDGIVLANSLTAPNMDMSLKDIYLAFAKNTPVSDTDCTLRPNPYTCLLYTSDAADE